MKKIFTLLALFASFAVNAQVFNVFSPGPSGLVVSNNTFALQTPAGTCTGLQFLRGDATCNFILTGTEPRLAFNASGQGTDLKMWDFDLSAGVFTGRTRTDADGAGQNWLSVTRGTTTAISNISFANATNNPSGTWLGTGTFSFNGNIFTAGNISVQNASTPNLSFRNTSGGTDSKMWNVDVGTTTFTIDTKNDAGATGKTAISVSRTSTAITSIALGNATDNPPVTSSGSVTAAAHIPSASTVPVNGLYLPATNTIGLATNTTNRISIDATGAWLVGGSAGSATNVLTSNGPGVPPSWAAAGGGSGNIVQQAVKTSDTPRTSTIVLAIDPALQIASVVPGLYKVNAYVPFQFAGAAAVPGARISIGISTAPTANTRFSSMCTENSSAATQSFGGGDIAVTPNAVANIVLDSPAGCTISGTVTVATTATLGVYWAQNSSSGTATTAQAGGWFRLEKLN